MRFIQLFIHSLNQGDQLGPFDNFDLRNGRLPVDTFYLTSISRAPRSIPNPNPQPVGAGHILATSARVIMHRIASQKCIRTRQKCDHQQKGKVVSEEEEEQQ